MSSSPKRRTRSSATKHFVSTKRSRRSRTGDAVRHRQSAVISATDPRYYTPRGPNLYDVANVDDGSPRAKAIAYRGKYTDPARPEDWTSPKLAEVFSKGKQIGAGKEATVWLHEGYVWKIYKVPYRASGVKQNIDFLRQNRNSGVVPKLHYASEDWGYLKMQYLRGYEPLSSDVVTRSVRYRTSLLQSLAEARAKLPKNKRYRDLTKWDNIAVRHHRNGMVAGVKFYEGGTSTKPYKGNLRAQQYVLEMAANLRIRDVDFARQVKNDRVEWLR